MEALGASLTNPTFREIALLLALGGFVNNLLLLEIASAVYTDCLSSNLAIHLKAALIITGSYKHIEN